MNFFFDRNMPVRLACMIAAYEPSRIVRHHNQDERFSERTTDVEWMKALSGDGRKWVILSADAGILKNRLKNEAERAALWEANFTFFLMTKHWAEMKIYDYAWKFLKVWPEILEKSEVTIPTIFKVEAGRSLKVVAIRHTRA